MVRSLARTLRAAAAALACGVALFAVAAPHPMDPLTAEEILAAADILLQGRAAQPGAIFQSIEVREPSKGEVLAYRGGAGPESVAQSQVTLNSNHITNLPEVVTAAAAAAFDGPQDVTREKCADFAKRRDEVLAALNAIPGVRCPRPQGAFYAFPDISVAFGKKHGANAIANDVDFCNALLDAKGVACVPGSAFGEPKAIRISYTCKPKELTDGLKRVQEFFAELA